MARKRKPGPRTKSGRLSRAHKRNPELRDMGTHESQAKRRALVGTDGDVIFAETALGSLLSYGYIDRAQYDEGLYFGYMYSAIYGHPFPRAATLEMPGGRELSEERLRKIEERFKEKLGLLGAEQERTLVDVAACNIWPTWFFAEKLNLKILPQDHRQKNALISGLGALLGRSAKYAA